MDFKFFDADNHYYEAEDAFTRYPSDRMASERYVRWLTEADGKRRRLFFGTREADTVTNPTFHKVIAPGSYHGVLMQQTDHRTPRVALDTAPISPAYRSREARLAAMDEQGVEKIVLFPTLGVTVEGLMADDADMLHDCFHAFNRWLDDDWGFAHQDRIFAAPYISLRDVDRAVQELEWVLDHGARVITMRPGPAYGRSPAHPHYDPFWARVNEAGVTVVVHAGDAGLSSNGYAVDGFSASFRAGGAMRPSIKLFAIERAAHDWLATLILEKLFDRFPNVRIASVENGSEFLAPLFRKLRTTARRMPGYFTEDPVDTFRRQVWINPFWEDDVEEIVDLMGDDRVIFGSDWPHVEGLPEPTDWVTELQKLPASSVPKIMGANTSELNERRPR